MTVTEPSHRADKASLRATLADAEVCVQPMLTEHHAALRQACEQDREVWDIFPLCMIGEHFETSNALYETLAQEQGWIRFAILNHGEVVGMSHYINADNDNAVVEIGGTYIAPSVRGGNFNRRIKTLMIEHAFSCGFRRIEFRVDTRNQRSMAAVRKLGAKDEGVLRKNKVTWTGFVRDTAVFGLLRDDWNTRNI
jgi:RimJ/RimL family protein N-acetyltransferase|tara:strand:- start:2534 stop:3118 length:585 start_codon:yes stop_codon:yes gene_type:complete